MKKINCVLLIDDNPGDNLYHSIIIEDADITNHIRTALNGREALDYLKKADEPSKVEEYPKPDIIFLDINMPGMNGFEFLEEYGKLAFHLKSKVVVMLSTSLNPADKTIQDHNKDVAAFINKPLDIDELKKIVDQYF